MIFLLLSPLSWQSMKTEHFTLFYLPGSERMARSVALLLEPELLRVSSFLRTPPLEGVTVVLAPDERSFRSLQGGGISPFVTGMAYPERRLIYLRPLTGGEVRHSSLRAVVAHELTHLVLREKLNGRPVPLWLNEGLSVYLGEEPFYSRAERLVPAALTGRYLPFRQLEDEFPSSSAAAATAYAQSGDFVMFLIRRFGDDAFLKFLDHLARGEDPDPALAAVFHMGLSGLEEEWLSRVRRTYGLIPALGGGALLWFLISLLALFAYGRKYLETRRRQQKWRELEQHPPSFPQPELLTTPSKRFSSPLLPFAEEDGTADAGEEEESEEAEGEEDEEEDEEEDQWNP